MELLSSHNTGVYDSRVQQQPEDLLSSLLHYSGSSDAFNLENAREKKWKVQKLNVLHAPILIHSAREGGELTIWDKDLYFGGGFFFLVSPDDEVEKAEGSKEK